MSGCGAAVELSSNNYQIHSFFSRLNLRQSSSKPYQLKYINAGAGTTGTRSIHHLFCNKWKVKSLHFSIQCQNTTHKPLDGSNGMVGNKLLIWYNHLTKCVVNPKHNCLSRDIIQSLEARLPLILSEYEFLSDTPVDSLFLEIFALMKFQVRSEKEESTSFVYYCFHGRSRCLLLFEIPLSGQHDVWSSIPTLSFVDKSSGMKQQCFIHLISLAASC
jgi:hypothetical protein